MDNMLLVIGCGNTHRRDDGVGPKVAVAVEALHLPGVLTMACPRLTAELADPLAHAGAAIFVDAAVDDPRHLGIHRLDPSGSLMPETEASDPSTLLALARDAFGRAPEAWMLTVPAEELGCGESLSPIALQGVKKAVQAVMAMHCNMRYRGEN